MKMTGNKFVQEIKDVRYAQQVCDNVNSCQQHKPIVRHTALEPPVVGTLPIHALKLLPSLEIMRILNYESRLQYGLKDYQQFYV